MAKEKKKRETISNRVTVKIDWFDYLHLRAIAKEENMSLERALNFLLNRGIEEYLWDEKKELGVFLVDEIPF